MVVGMRAVELHEGLYDVKPSGAEKNISDRSSKTCNSITGSGEEGNDAEKTG